MVEARAPSISYYASYLGRKRLAEVLFIFATGGLVASFVGGVWIRASASASSSGVSSRTTAAFGLWTITFQEAVSTEEMVVTTSHEVTYQAWQYMAPHAYPYIQAIRTLALGSALGVLSTLLLYVSGLRYRSKKERSSLHSASTLTARGHSVLGVVLLALWCVLPHAAFTMFCVENAEGNSGDADSNANTEDTTTSNAHATCRTYNYDEVQLGWCWFLFAVSVVIAGLTSWLLQCANQLRHKSREALLRSSTPRSSSSGSSSRPTPSPDEYLASLTGEEKPVDALGAGRSPVVEGDRPPHHV